MGVDALSYDETTVSALARHLGVDWHTCWDAVEDEARARVADPTRLKNVKTLGVDGHIRRPSRIGADRAVTIIVDLTVTRTDASTPGSWTPSSATPEPSTRWSGRPCWLVSTTISWRAPGRTDQSSRRTLAAPRTGPNITVTIDGDYKVTSKVEQLPRID